MFRIAHAGVPGRLRLADPARRGRRGLVARIAVAPLVEPRIHAAAFRPATGSVVVQFDPALPLAEVVAAVERAAAGPPDGARAVPSGGGPAFHAGPGAALVARLGADPARGLSGAEAARRLAAEGPNRTAREAPPSALALLSRQFAGLPVRLLLGSAAASLVTGGVADALATLAVVTANALFGWVTEGEAERRIHALTDLSGEPARVLRDGGPAEVPAGELVAGDIVLLGPGRQVPADARLLAAEALMADESALTGESLPVAKAAEDGLCVMTPVGSRHNMVHAGTIVAEGTGRALVVATGPRTEAARIEAATSGHARPAAPVETELAELGARLARASLGATALFLALGLLRGHPLRALLRDALALAVAAVPEGLPAVATTTLSHGLRRMEREGILIRQLSAVESLGALETLCLDKTGTLTENRMAVVEVLAGLAPAAPADREALGALAEVALLNNDWAPGAESSPTEAALVAFGTALGLDPAAIRARHPRLATVPRRAGRPFMVTAHGGPAPFLAVKGAPEAVLARSSRVRTAAGDLPLGPEERARILAENDRIAARPARVLGLARAEAGAEAAGEPRDLVFLGLVGMADPVRAGAAVFVRGLHGAGIATVLITGDQAATAAAIARELDLSAGRPLRVIDAPDIAGMPPDLLAALAGEAHVFARVASHEKLAIVRALQSAGRVVGMTGDGVNDGPALNAADVGIAMGASGTALARDVANVVIRDDRLETLLSAIARGRAIHRNIRRALEFLVTTNLSEILVELVEALHGPGELETPMELLWINLATDVLPGIGLALAEPDADAMHRPPRARDEGILPPRDLRRMAGDGAAIAGSALLAHFAGLARHGAGPRTRAMTYLALSLGQLLYTLACQRRDIRRLSPATLLDNPVLDRALLASAGLAVLPFAVPGLRRLLGIAPLGARDAGLSLAAAFLPVGSVFLRRAVALRVEEREARPCAASS